MKLLFCAALVVVLAHAHATSLSLNSQFAGFKHTHNKKYTDAFEEAFRKGIFASNVAKISQHNEEFARGEHNWNMAVNQFTDLTHAEFMEMQTLRIPDMPHAERKYRMTSKVMAGDVDWRDSGMVTDVKDQGQCGSCWAFGAVASMEAAHFEKHGSTLQMSEQQIVDCDNRNSGCNGGWYDTAWQYVQEEGGLESMADYPYTGRDGSCKAGQAEFVSGISGCVGGPNSFCDNHGKNGDEEDLKKMINDRPIAVAVDATPFQFYSSGIMDCRNYHSINHAVTSVGYVDGSHYIVKNSWGKSWGESGYVRVGMGGNPCGIADYPAYAIAT
jgi:C1A family cysteine protease